MVPGYDVSFVREDLVRATHSVTQTSYSNGMMITSTRQAPNDYSEIVIDFGNGIILDYNNNLCIDLLRFYDLARLSNYHIVRKPIGFSLEATNSYDLEAGVFSSTYGLNRQATFKDNSIEIESGLLKAKRTIEIGPQSIALVGNFLGIDVRESAKLVTPTTLEVQGFWKDTTFVMESPDRIKMEGYFEIRSSQDHITVIYTGIFGLTTERTFFRTRDGLIFFDEMNRGVEVSKDGSLIKISRNGQPKVEYTLQTR